LTFLEYCITIAIQERLVKPEYRELRRRQLGHSLASFKAAKGEIRPQRGWLRAIREALGLTLQQVGRPLRISRTQVSAFEKAEAEDRITLHSLRRIAEAMGCELVYAVVPKSTGTLQQLAEQSAREEATKRVLSVEHTMALENQAAGNVEQKIEDETQRILKHSTGVQRGQRSPAS
jgi:predicted DNA-binding mobile mystery protein A